MSVEEIQKMIEEEETRLASIQDYIDGLNRIMIQYQATINDEEITKVEIQTNILNLDRDLVKAEAKERCQQNASSVNNVTAALKKVNPNETMQVHTPIFQPWLSEQSMGTETGPGTSSELRTFNNKIENRVGDVTGQGNGNQNATSHNNHNTTKFDLSEARNGIEQKEKLLADMVRGKEEKKK